VNLGSTSYMFDLTCALMCEMRVKSAPKDVQQNEQLIGFSVSYNTQHSKTDAGFLSLKNTGLKKMKVDTTPCLSPYCVMRRPGYVPLQLRADVILEEPS
jgi:hypothetical protein